ncbi:MAG TPA: hypothetical protein VKU82_08615, partial [Planctomycetaceae bacterium]|nr:hypothetical protein [Planctomycetaceae bacterium]
MTGSLRALLSGAIDYAGVFPPASLSLDQAIAEYRRHCGDQAAWMLGRFICPADRLAELAASDSPERSGWVSAIVPGEATAKASLDRVPQSIASVAGFPLKGAVDTLEFRWPAELAQAADVAE